MHIGELADLAEEHGIRVVWHRGGPKGAWLPPGTVSVREGMSGAQTRCTLAHELAHALAGDPAGCEGWRERRADERAAEMLISDEAYAAAEVAYGAEPGALARELDVTVRMVEVWRDCRERRR